MATPSKKRVRIIVVDGRKFAWRFTSGHLQGTFRAYAEGHYSSPLLIDFPIAKMGDAPEKAREIDLYTPRWAATLIRFGIQQGWKPEEARTPFRIDDGIRVLAALDYQPLDAGTASPGSTATASSGQA